MVEFLEDRKSVNAIYYAAVLRKLREISKKRPGKLRRRILFHYDNAPAHTSKLCRNVLNALQEVHWEILRYPPYSPDLAPSDFFLFPKLKEAIKGTRHDSKDAAKKAAVEWLSAQSLDYFREGLGRWQHHMEKCFHLEGDSVEK